MIGGPIRDIELQQMKRHAECIELDFIKCTPAVKQHAEFSLSLSLSLSRERVVVETPLWIHGVCRYPHKLATPALVSTSSLAQAVPKVASQVQGRTAACVCVVDGSRVAFLTGLCVAIRFTAQLRASKGQACRVLSTLHVQRGIRFLVVQAGCDAPSESAFPSICVLTAAPVLASSSFCCLRGVWMAQVHASGFRVPCSLSARSR